MESDALRAVAKSLNQLATKAEKHLAENQRSVIVANMVQDVNPEAAEFVKLALGVDTLPPTLTVDEVGPLLGISRQSAYKGVHSGEIPSLRVGRRYVIPMASLLKALSHG